MANPDKTEKRGIVYLVGAGPGDPELATVKALRLISECDVILYDYLVPPEILESASPKAELIYVGKQGGEHTLPQERINSLLVEHAKQGKKVVRLKGGDPFVFGRGGEEAEELAEAGVKFEFVPGVSSAIAAPAYAGIPLTHRKLSSSVIIVTGHEDPTKPFSAICWDKVAAGDSTLVILMGMRNLRENMQKIMEGGISPNTPVAIVRWGTRSNQKTISGTVATIADVVEKAKFKAPAVIVVGKVAEFREKLKWFEEKPLIGKRILVTRAREQASELSKLLREAGAETIEFPTIEIIPQLDHPQVELAMRALPSFDWLVFTSTNGVKFFFEALEKYNMDVRSVGKSKIAAIGPATAAALKERYLSPDLVPEEFKAEGLVERFVRENLMGKKFLLARAEEARDVLPNELKKKGAEVVIAPIYRSSPPSTGAKEKLEAVFKYRRPHMITFASSSTVRNFMAIAEEISLNGVDVACIGPVTADTAREFNLEVKVQPNEYTIPAFVEAIISFYLSAERS